MARMPDSPSTMTSRASAAVGATRAIRLHWPVSILCRTHSAPVRVLPNPRPARISQTNHSQPGGRCLSRALPFGPSQS